MPAKPKEGVLKDIMDKEKAIASEKLKQEKKERALSFTGSVKSTLTPKADESRSSISESEIEIVKERYGESLMSIRSVIHPTSYFETTIHVLKAFVGAGLLAMGDVLKNSGMLVGPILLVFMAILCTYCIHLLLVCGNKCTVKWRLPVDPTFAETIELSFKLGPKPFKKTAAFMKKFVTISLLSTQLGFCSVYYLIIATGIGRYFAVFGFNLNVRIYLCMLFPVILIVALIRNLKFLAPLSFVANMLIITAITMVLLMATRDLPHISERPLVNPIERWPFAFGTIVFAYEGINLIVPLRNEMKYPASFRTIFGVLNVSITIITILYTSFGIICYWKYGDLITGNVSANLPKGHWTAIISDGSISIALLLSYPLQFHVAFKIAFELIVGNCENCIGAGKKLLMWEFILRTSLVTLTFLFATFVPYLSLVISLVGAMFSSWLAIFFPVLAHISLFSPWSKNHKEINVTSTAYITQMWIVLFCNFLCLLVGVAGFIFGTYVTGSDLINKLKEDYFGPPPK